jgi:THO complex subunit 2
MQERERVANEEAEKRLKAALTAKREPVIASRVASPAVGVMNAPAELPTNTNPDMSMDATSTQENNAPDDATMDTETSTASVSLPSAEVRHIHHLKSE